MNSLEIRNQKLAELRAQKAKGIRRPITVIEQLPKREVEEEEKNKKKEKEIEIEIEKDLALGSEVEEKVGDVAKELKKDLELLQAFEPLPSGLVQPSEQPKILKLKSEFAAKKQASDKNQQEIAYLQGLIHSKKSNIASILTSLKSYEQEKHEIQLEVTQLLSQQSQIRSSYSCKVISN